jgi:hypothetical protein
MIPDPRLSWCDWAPHKVDNRVWRRRRWRYLAGRFWSWLKIWWPIIAVFLVIVVSVVWAIFPE